MELKCQVQQYAWGKVGTKSLAAEFAANGRPDDFCVDGTAPYAELWMGTHPNGPSFLKGLSGLSLADYIGKNPQMLGQESRKVFGDQLPFLFKVLSVNKALSIQAHPDKKHAEQLFKDRPDVYKDPNHKPEMAIALTDFEGLCGFRPLSQIQANLKSVPQLAEAIGKEATENLLKASNDNYAVPLKKAFTALMQCSKEALGKSLTSLRDEINKKTCLTGTERLLQRLYFDFPGDVGCFVIYFLNLIVLKPGEAMFLGPNLPHAYLSGDCIECMACSDNVVRAGLTPKLIDVPTLCEMLIYECPPDGGVEEAFKFKPAKDSESSLLYDAPVPDFSVAKLVAKKGQGKVTFPARKSASIVIVTDCERGSYSACHDGKTDQPYVQEGALKKGLVLFLEANDQLSLAADDKEDVEAYQAFC
jgi:mannose-6-phosphate isomerase